MKVRLLSQDPSSMLFTKTHISDHTYRLGYIFLRVVLVIVSS